MAGLTRGQATGPALFLALIVSGFGLGTNAFAQGAGGDGTPTAYPLPATAKEAYSPIGEGFVSPLDARDDLKGPKPYLDEREERLKAQREQRQMAPFFRDTEIKANSRSYWFDEDAFGNDTPKALTTGGSLTYQSGFAADFLQLRSVLYTSQPLYANGDAGDTSNLTEDGDQITTLGQINARMRFAQQELTVGRQLVRTPYINPYDVRMIPLTFEGIVLLPERKDQELNYIASYLWRYKPRDQADFISFSEGLGVDEVDEGVLITGIRRRTRAWNYGLTNYWIKDTLNTAYGEIDYLLPFGGGEGQPSFRISVNDLDQRSVGADLIAGAPYQTYQASARLIASYRNFVLTGGLSRTGDGADIQKPFGFSTSFTSMIVASFNSAGEQAYLAGLSYDFADFGLDGLKAYVGWGRGTDIVDPDTGAPQPDQSELDLRLSFEPHRGRLQGLRVEVEYIDLRQPDAGPSDDLTQFRTIVNYSVPLL
jgi:outer membrane porin, OprD family